MIRSEDLTVKSCRTEVGIQTEHQESIIVCINNLEEPLGWTSRGKTSEDVLMLLLNSDWRNHLVIEEGISYFNEQNQEVQQIWVDLKCLQFLINESDNPSLVQPFLDYIITNETEMKEELLNGLSYDGYIAE